MKIKNDDDWQIQIKKVDALIAAVLMQAKEKILDHLVFIIVII